MQQTKLLTVELQFEHDVVLTRQRARQIADLIGFDVLDQTRIATAVSEIARNVVRYANRGRVEFCIERSHAPVLLMRILDDGPGIADLKSVMDGRYVSKTGVGVGIVGAKRLMDQFHIESSPESGTTVVLGKIFPKDSAVTADKIGNIVAELARRASQNPFEEIQQQNQELLGAMETLREREEELLRLNQELDETNRGVVALYAELDDKAGDFQRASELKSSFLSNMSHEFRTPLSSILSLAGLLLSHLDGPLTSEQEKQVSLMRSSAESLMSLVNDLLDLAKIEAGKTEVRPSAFEITDIFGAMRGMFRPLLRNDQVELVFEEISGIPMLYTDEGKLSQILRNFISNALKFTERGEVRVSARLEDGKRVTFSVIDTGIGIAPENLQNVFLEFVQVVGTHQKSHLGTGLGLPLSQKLAKLLGGSVALESEHGIGSTFSVTLPLVYSGSAEHIKA